MSVKQSIILCCMLIVGLAACVGAFIFGRAIIGESVDPMAQAVAKASSESYESEGESRQTESEMVSETVPETTVETEADVIEETIISEENPNEVYSTKTVDYRRIVIADELSVRVNSIADADRIGILTYGDEVQVTGIVLCNGEPIGWSRINYQGQVGYVWSEYLAESLD